MFMVSSLNVTPQFNEFIFSAKSLIKIENKVGKNKVTVLQRYTTVAFIYDGKHLEPGVNSILSNCAANNIKK